MKLETQELQIIEASKAESIKKTFEPMVAMLEGFEADYNALITAADKEITKEVTNDAKKLRISIGKVRIETEKLRKEQKEEYLRAGKAIDGVSNILKWAITDKENKLKEIENYFEIQEKNRLEALQLERAERLSVYVDDAHDRDLAKFADDEFEALLSMKKKEHEERIEAEKKAELERIAKEKAEAEERERIRKENEQLRKEASERERLAKIEAEKRAKIEAERKAKEAAERAKHEAALKAEREAREKIEREAREAREKLEAERKAKEAAERKAKEEEAARIEAELKKGDSDKVADLIADLEILKTKYEFKSTKNKRMYSDVNTLIGKVIAFIQK